MTQSAKAQEPSMEEILASIRRIIADDDSSKAAPAAAKPPEPAPPPPAAVAVPPRPAPVPPAPARVPLAPPRPAPAANNQQDIDAMLADLEAPPKMAPPPMPVAPPVPDVLDLTEAMAAPPPAPNFRTIDGANDVVFTDRAAEPAPEPPPRVERQYAPPPPPPQAVDQALISNSTMSAVDSAFNSLANTVLGNNARTLEDLVKEMLRPMLKNWLDDNLPSMVERIVRAEIERVSRGRP
jgi:cell pole-organizing protein PopZ